MTTTDLSVGDRPENRRTLIVGFFGTSIMEHLEAFNTQMTNFTARADARVASELGRYVA
ncbi:hypothetical protein [Kitasatospora sp. GP82]|uniref:hypothetical protein n=1 Tax=Kitasatospora sp. GP82 TaxID=3035089 RepID=UPI0024757B12|nr:hypothetical protein [Kitasatospora sp. GP82]MDH6130312.1 hypothetical protein [Kitasatospora sp. GP82]